MKTINKDRCRVQSFSVSPKYNYVFSMIDEMARRERKSKSEVVIRCIEYYYNKKWPGNPQPPLYRPQKQNIDMATLREARLRSAIIFLRFTAKFSYSQIATITKKSYGSIYRLCRAESDFYRTEPGFHGAFDNRRRPKIKQQSNLFRKNMFKYQDRLKRWLDGSFKNLKGAFSF